MPSFSKEDAEVYVGDCVQNIFHQEKNLPPIVIFTFFAG
jgi:hypothetical protein